MGAVPSHESPFDEWNDFLERPRLLKAQKKPMRTCVIDFGGDLQIFDNIRKL